MAEQAKRVQATHQFRLPSGVECEVRSMTAKHQEMLTIQSSKPQMERMNQVLQDCIVRLGSETNITDDLILEMVSCDRKKALFELRQFSYGFDPNFEFQFEYLSEEGKKKKAEISVDLDTYEFEVTPMKYKDESGNVVEANFTEYADVIAHKKVTIILPQSGEEVQFTLLDGKGENIGARTPKRDRSSHTLVRMRQPITYTTSSAGNKVPLQLNLNNLSLVDIEFLRKSIKQYEGDVDTILQFEHPETGNLESVDIMGLTAFFYRSEAI